MRLKTIGWITVGVFLFLGMALFNLTVIQGTRFKDLSNKNCIRLQPQEGSRGRILDRNGEVIVGNSLSYDVMVLPQGEKQTNELLAELSRILNIDIRNLRNAFRNGFVASSIPVAVAKNIDAKKAITLEEMKLDLGGVTIQPHPVRDYPFGGLACHVLGYLSEIDHWRLTKLADYGYKTKDIVGFGGIEEKYDYYLRQEEGGLSVEVDHQGRFMRVLGFRPPQNGRDIQLTLDIKIQKIVEENLGDKRGSVIVMDPYNGAIIAMASSPNFLPAAFVKRTDKYLLSDYFSDPGSPLINRAISSSYPPASVFKLIGASAALDTGKVDLSTTFFCPGGINIGNRKFACWDTHGAQHLPEAIAHSCDVFFYRTGLLLGPENLHEWALKLGLSKPTSIELPYEVSGFLPHPLWKKIYKFRNWYDGDTANFAIGQGDVLVTPLQLIRVMTVFANKGLLVHPHIVKAIGGQEVAFYPNKPIKAQLKEGTILIIRKALRDTVALPTGTANPLAPLSVPVAGKTGTAQVSRGLPHGWFLGFLPFREPKFVICVFLENGGSGWYASIVAKQIIQGMIDQGFLG